MSKKYPGGVLSRTAPVPSGNFESSTASGMWNMDDVSKFKQQGLWPSAGNAILYTDDVFSTYLYRGNGSTQNISNGVALADTPTWSSYAYSSFSTIANVNASSAGVAIVGLQPTNSAIVNSLNTSVTTQWSASQTSTGATSNTFQRAVFIDSSGNVYTTGRAIEVNASFGERSTVSKYNSSGTLQWQRLLDSAVGTVGNFQTYSIVVDSSGNVFVGGMHYNNQTYRDAIIKYNSSGTLQWKRTLVQDNANGMDGAILALSSSDELYVAGKGHDGTNPFYCYVAKLNNSDGLTAWQRKLSTGLYDTCGSITVDSAGSVYIGGYAKQYSTPIGFIAKYNSSGTIQFQYAITGATSPVDSLARDADGSVYIGTTSKVIRMTSSGTISSQFALNGTAKLSIGGSTLYMTGNFGSVRSLVTVPSFFTNISGKSGSVIISGSSLSFTALGATDSAGALTNSAGTFNDTAAGADITNAVASSTPTSSSQPAITSAGGLVWIKGRTNWSHYLHDTVRGTGKELSTDTTAAAGANGYLTAFNSNGFDLAAVGGVNSNTNAYVSWTFRKQPKFFDVVTWTGNGTAGRTIAHNLGSVPGCIIVKRLDVVNNWHVYHRSLPIPNSYALYFNLTNAAFTSSFWNNTDPTSSVFSLSSDSQVNANGGTYVAYLFAHDAGGFGESGTDNVISCGSVANGTRVNLGYEPQWLLLKQSDGVSAWFIYDSMRGLSADYSSTNAQYLLPNSSSAESPASNLSIDATGFTYGGLTGNLIYIAIRRPMKPPTVGTSVFESVTSTTTNDVLGTLEAADMAWFKDRTTVSNWYVSDRMRGLTLGYYNPTLYLNTTDAELTPTTGDNITSNSTYIAGSNGKVLFGGAGVAADYPLGYSFKRAPKFLDVVCYTGTGTATAVSHNLRVVPEFIIVKRRNAAGWNGATYHYALGNTKASFIDSAGNPATLTGFWNNTTPTSSAFTVGNNGSTGASGGTYVAYLFATCAGVSKVGTYTGNGSLQTIDCGFTTGARFVIIKRTDAGGAWYVWDTARGIVAGNDRHLSLNATAAEVTDNDSVDPATTGFIVNQLAATDINISTATYNFLAIA